MYDNYHYPAGADNENAPWNQHDIPEEEFNINYYITLKKNIDIVTDDYIPGASGVDYEPDDEGGYCAEGCRASALRVKGYAPCHIQPQNQLPPSPKGWGRGLNLQMCDSLALTHLVMNVTPP